jgi:hypothetical protein
MPPDSYDPARDLTPRFLDTVSRWIASSGEVLVVMRYLHAAGARDYALIRTPDEFRRLVDVCPVGTDVIVFKNPQLPVRGCVDEDLIHRAREVIPDGAEFFCVCLPGNVAGDPRLSGSMGDSHESLTQALLDGYGNRVAVGPCPAYWQDDNVDMVSASKGGVNGAR